MTKLLIAYITLKKQQKNRNILQHQSIHHLETSYRLLKKFVFCYGIFEAIAI